MSDSLRDGSEYPPLDSEALCRSSGCSNPPAAPAGDAVVVAPNCRSGWVCATCCDRAALDPAWTHGCQVAVMTGIPHMHVVKVFASLGLVPPTIAAGVTACVESILRMGRLQ